MSSVRRRDPDRDATLLTMIFLITAITVLLARPLRGQAIAPMLAARLAVAYDTTYERGWCVTAWHDDRGRVIVDDAEPSTAVQDHGKYFVRFVCPAGQPTLHTHVPGAPRPSPQDMANAQLLALPFMVVQYRPDRFAFWFPAGSAP